MPTRSTPHSGMTLKFFKFIQRHIEDDFNVIVAPNTNFFDELIQNCLPPLKARTLIGACPCEQVAAIALGFLVLLFDLCLIVLGGGLRLIGCVLVEVGGDLFHTLALDTALIQLTGITYFMLHISSIIFFGNKKDTPKGVW